MSAEAVFVLPVPVGTNDAPPLVDEEPPVGKEEGPPGGGRLIGTDDIELCDAPYDAPMGGAGA